MHDVLLYVFGSVITPMPATAAVTQHETSLTQAAAQLNWPGYGSAAITAPDFPGASEYHGSDASMPIASMTKTITALVVLEAKPLDGNADGPTIAFTPDHRRSDDAATAVGVQGGCRRARDVHGERGGEDGGPGAGEGCAGPGVRVAVGASRGLGTWALPLPPG